VLAEYLPASAKPNLVTTRIAKWLEVKASEVEAGTLSPGYLRELRRHAKPGGHFSFFDRLSICEIDYALLEDWLAWLAKRKLGPATQRGVLLEFRSFLGWLWRRGNLPAVPPMPTVRVPEYLPKTLTLKTQNRILAAIPEEKRGPFLAMAHLGIRPGEARALRVADLEADEDGLWVMVKRAAKGAAASAPVRETKNRSPKRLPVRGELAEWVDRHVDPAGRLVAALLFPNPATGAMWGHEPLRRTWERACKATRVQISMYQGPAHPRDGTQATRRRGPPAPEALRPQENHLGSALRRPGGHRLGKCGRST
jgi:integrase